MSSPPPTGSASLKRRGSNTGTASKKPKHGARKPSAANASFSRGSSHPLRQTSFPPEAYSPSIGARSPSVASTATLGNAGRGPGASSIPITAPGGDAAGQGQEEDEDEDAGDDYGTAFLGQTNNEDEQEEREKMMVLIEAFDPDQMQRYEAFKRANLNKAGVKKIANQVLNQSITQNVATVIAGFTKMYAGEIVEKALDIQAERGDKGPLLPDHLREAVRRYRAEGAGAVGYRLNASGGPIGGAGGGPGVGELAGGGIGRMFR